jgi:multidrug efflux pump subunit AcrA (membrane-fusion protein)
MRTHRTIVLFTLIAASCKQKAEYVQPQKRDVVEAVYASGVVKAANQYQVFSSVSGLIKEVYVREGDTVSADAPLFSIQNDNPELNARNAALALELLREEASEKRGRLLDLRLQSETAKERYLQDSINHERQQRLWKDGIGSANEQEQRLLSFNNARRQWKSIEAAYRLAQSQIRLELERAENTLLMMRNAAGDLIIRSRSAGKVYRIMKEAGEMVLPQEPVAVIGDADNFIIELQVDEYDVARVSEGQKVLISMDSYKQQVFEAEIQRLIPFMSQLSKTFTAEAIFTKAPPKLYPNLSLEANIIIREVKGALSIPLEYLIRDEYVLLSNKDTVKVKTGARSMQHIEILNGLDASSKIILP